MRRPRRPGSRWAAASSTPAGCDPYAHDDAPGRDPPTTRSSSRKWPDHRFAGFRAFSAFRAFAGPPRRPRTFTLTSSARRREVICPKHGLPMLFVSLRRHERAAMFETLRRTCYVSRRVEAPTVVVVHALESLLGDGPLTVGAGGATLAVVLTDTARGTAGAGSASRAGWQAGCPSSWSPGVVGRRVRARAPPHHAPSPHGRRPLRRGRRDRARAAPRRRGAHALDAGGGRRLEPLRRAS